MKIILDTNEFIFGLDREGKEKGSIKLLEIIRLLIDECNEFRLFVPEIIRKEVQKNIPIDLEADFYRLIYSNEKIECHFLMEVSKELFYKYYNNKGLKEGDALVAAFAEFMGVDYLISENRHIYRDLDIQEFITVNAQEFLELLEKL